MLNIHFGTRVYIAKQEETRKALGDHAYERLKKLRDELKKETSQYRDTDAQIKLWYDQAAKKIKGLVRVTPNGFRKKGKQETVPKTLFFKKNLKDTLDTLAKKCKIPARNTLQMAENPDVPLLKIPVPNGFRTSSRG